MSRLGCRNLFLFLFMFGRLELLSISLFTCLNRHANFLLFCLISIWNAVLGPDSGQRKDISRLFEFDRTLGYCLNYGVQMKGSELPGQNTHARAPLLFLSKSSPGGRSGATTWETYPLRTFSRIRGRAKYRLNHFWDCTGEWCFE